MNWDDLRIILAIRDSGTYAGASTRLRLDETTVARRLARVQRALGVTLFDPVEGVRKPTPQCEAILAKLLDIERQINEVGKLSSEQPKAVGRFRIASTNSIAEEILAPRTAEFLAGNPGITLQFLTGNENVKLSRWQADLAVRLRKPERGEFTISKLADIRLYLLNTARASRDGGEALVCAYPDDLELTPESLALAERGLQTQARCFTDNIRVVRALVQSGACTGILPEYMCGDLLDDPDAATLLRERREAWLLVQPHLKGNAAARLVIDWVRGCFKTLNR